MQKYTCCFTGHRKLPQNKIDGITKRLHAEIDNLIHDGVTDFISGGALGFDLLAASMIVAKKEMGPKIKLIFMLPCREQDAHWTSDQKKLYRSLLLEADEIIYVSEEYNDGCMKKRNYAMVERSNHCICAFLYRHNFYDGSDLGNAQRIMTNFFWLEELVGDSICVFQLQKYNDKEDERIAYGMYNDYQYDGVFPPVAIALNYNLINDFMREWAFRFQELKKKEITRDEYFEWKINWPYTCDDGGRFEPSIQWRNGKG